MAEGRAVIATSDRCARIEAARAELLQAELMEESAIRELERVGVTVERRADANPQAVLAADACLT
jgi:hypothetical protein